MGEVVFGEGACAGVRVRRASVEEALGEGEGAGFDGTDWEFGLFCQLAAGDWVVEVSDPLGSAFQWALKGLFVVRVDVGRPGEGMFKRLGV